MKIKLGVSILSATFIALSAYFAFDYSVKKAVALIEVPYASVSIAPHAVIDEKMIDTKWIPAAYVEDHAYLEKTEIIDKIVRLDSKIPKGSLFYKEMLSDKEHLKEYPSLLLTEDQVVFPLQLDVVRLGANTIELYQYVDVYVTLAMKKNEVIVDQLLKNIRVIGLKDRKGNNLDDEKSDHVPSIILLAVHQDYVDMLKKAVKLGSVDVFAPMINYEMVEECILNEESLVLPWLK